MAIHWEEVIPFRIKKSKKKAGRKCQKQIKNRFQFCAFQPFFNFFLLNIYVKSREGFFEWKKGAMLNRNRGIGEGESKKKLLNKEILLCAKFHKIVEYFFLLYVIIKH